MTPTQGCPSNQLEVSSTTNKSSLPKVRYPYRHWIAKDDEQLRQLRKECLTSYVIAGRLNRTVAAVKMRAATLGLPKISTGPRKLTSRRAIKTMSEELIKTLLTSWRRERCAIKVYIETGVTPKNLPWLGKGRK